MMSPMWPANSTRLLIISLPFLVSLPAGCGSDPVWQHPTKDSYEVKTDLADCERFFGGVDKDVEKCMRLKGWKQVK